MFKPKKRAELSINTIVILIILIVVLVVVILIFTGAMKGISSGLWDKIKSVLTIFKASDIQPVQ
jgi:hypothetical protein